MSLGTLYSVPYQATGKRIRAVAAFAGLKLDSPEGYVHFETNKTPEFLAKFPHGKIPAFEGADGFKLFESSAIARYVAALAPNSTLLGSDLKEAALVDQWCSVADSEIAQYIYLVLQLTRGSIPYSKPVHNTLVERAVRALTTVDKHLSTRTYLVTERITLADLAVASVVQVAAEYVIDPELKAKLPNVVRHAETILNHPLVKDVFGPINFCEKAAQFVPPKKEKEAKPAAAPTPKAEKKPAPKPTADDDDDEDDNLVPEEPKAKNPLDSLPKSTFNLEDWKRAYSNKETRGPGGALEWFYQNFDKAGFSVWRVDFKYNNELTQTFMSSNLIGGFFNRLEASRKYLFGSMGVLGQTNDSIISGALILRGQEAIPVVNVAPDFESYEYKKLDLENPEDKAYFEAALAWDLELEGKKWVDGKNFK
ncbi:hypothetical protein EW026_g4570 [Hermanssonia centrifuga]|uniref:Elongation factor 1-gamma n=1 Tax=Hermanssonia centrifuga TaxID=98765 RepID=A0A4S4KGQ8_9APHY|nr:hypothetical protein EW026_g4570 [Hermanssonia centrifuga]